MQPSFRSYGAGRLAVALGPTVLIWMVLARTDVRADLLVRLQASESTASASANPGPHLSDFEEDLHGVSQSEALAEVGNLNTAGARAFAMQDEFTLRSSAQYASPNGFLGAADAHSWVQTEIITTNTSPSVPITLGVEFFLPPGLLEVSQNIEAATDIPESSARIDAQLVEVDEILNLTETIFAFSAELFLDYVGLPTGGFVLEHSFTILSAESLNSQVDFTALLNPVVTEVTDGFTTTVTAEFPAFQGAVDIGVLTPVVGGRGRLFSFRYESTVAGGGFDGSSAIAAINDPLMFSGDTLSFTDAIVPEPSGLALMAIGVATLVAFRRAARTT